MKMHKGQNIMLHYKLLINLVGKSVLVLVNNRCRKLSIYEPLEFLGC